MICSKSSAKTLPLWSCSLLFSNKLIVPPPPPPTPHWIPIASFNTEHCHGFLLLCLEPGPMHAGPSVNMCEWSHALSQVSLSWDVVHSALQISLHTLAWRVCNRYGATVKELTRNPCLLYPFLFVSHTKVQGSLLVPSNTCSHLIYICQFLYYFAPPDSKRPEWNWILVHLLWFLCFFFSYQFLTGSRNLMPMILKQRWVFLILSWGLTRSCSHGRGTNRCPSLQAAMGVPF